MAQPADCNIQNQRNRPLLAQPRAANTTTAINNSSTLTMSLNPVRTRPGRSVAQAIASTTTRTAAVATIRLRNLREPTFLPSCGSTGEFNRNVVLGGELNPS